MYNDYVAIGDTVPVYHCKYLSKYK